MMILAQAMARYGFGGINGFFGVFLGFIIFLAVVIAFWKIFEILAAWLDWKEQPLFQIARILLSLLIFIGFVQLIFKVFG